MQGPALALWRSRFGPRALAPDLRSALQGAQLLVSGTGWASALEHEARIMAAARGLRSAAVVDHWVNYRERFERGGFVVWPDEVWLGDDDAMALAHRRLADSGARLCQFDNLYLQEQLRSIAAVPAQGDVLLVMEPMRSDWGRGVAGEWQALQAFMDHRVALGVPADAPIRLRPHPSDPRGKYAQWLSAARGVSVTLDRSDSLAQALSGCTWVAGCESYALVVALAAGRRVISTLPPWAPPCRLPQRGLLHLRDHMQASMA